MPPIDVTIGSTTYQIPSVNEDPNWAETLNTFLQGVAAELANVSSPGDIIPTSFNIGNNVTSATNITGLSFDVGTVRSATIEYNIDRQSSTGEVSETGIIQLTYNTTGTAWEFARKKVGDASVVFSVTSGGQFQYTSSNKSGTGYVGKMYFRAKALQN